jgi:predicted nucleic acid-binding protein
VDRLFLDANVLFSAAYRADAGVARLWTLESCVLLSSEYAIEEARRNLTEQAQLERLDALLQSVERVGGTSFAAELRGQIELPEKDWPILGGAVAARATHLITGDRRDFGAYFGKRVFGVLISPPGDYLTKGGSRGP